MKAEDRRQLHLLALNFWASAIKHNNPIINDSAIMAELKDNTTADLAEYLESDFPELCPNNNYQDVASKAMQGV